MTPGQVIVTLIIADLVLVAAFVLLVEQKRALEQRLHAERNKTRRLERDLGVQIEAMAPVARVRRLPARGENR